MNGKVCCMFGSVVAGFLWALGCSGTPSETGGPGLPAFTAPVTFVVTGIVPEVSRVNVTVNGRDIEPLFGDFDTAVTDRVTMNVPEGDSLNAFARGLEGDTLILYIGDQYFHVRTDASQLVTIELKYKGPHPVLP